MNTETWISAMAVLLSLTAIYEATKPRPQPKIIPPPQPDPKPEYIAPGVLFIPANLDLTMVVGGKLSRVSTHNDNPTIIYENK